MCLHPPSLEAWFITCARKKHSHITRSIVSSSLLNNRRNDGKEIVKNRWHRRSRCDSKTNVQDDCVCAWSFDLLSSNIVRSPSYGQLLLKSRRGRRLEHGRRCVFTFRPGRTYQPPDQDTNDRFDGKARPVGSTCPARCSNWTREATADLPEYGEVDAIVGAGSSRLPKWGSLWINLRASIMALQAKWLETSSMLPRDG